MMALIMITVIMMPLMIIQLPEDPTIPLLVRPSQKTSEGDISRTESGIIDPLVSKQPEKILKEEKIKEKNTKKIRFLGENANFQGKNILCFR